MFKSSASVAFVLLWKWFIKSLNAVTDLFTNHLQWKVYFNMGRNYETMVVVSHNIDFQWCVWTHVFATMFIPNFIKYNSVCAKRFWMSLQLLARSVRSSVKSDINVLNLVINLITLHCFTLFYQTVHYDTTDKWGQGSSCLTPSVVRWRCWTFHVLFNI